jgi:hypothetical protein
MRRSQEQGRIWHMNTADIVRELEHHRDLLERAIQVLTGSIKSRRGTRRHMSPESRRKISLAKRRWWAKQKRK